MGKNLYKAKNILNTTFHNFESQISQANPNNKITDLERYYKKIVDKSFDAFLISIENYNKPHLKNKVEVFAILIINAWELLLKAKIIKDSGDSKSIFKHVKGKEEYTISVEECVKKYIVRKMLSEIIYYN